MEVTLVKQINPGFLEGLVLNGTYRVLDENETQYLIDVSSKNFMANPDHQWIPKNNVIVEQDSEENEYDIPEILAGIILSIGAEKDFEEAEKLVPTVDDFFDLVGISVEDRSDFIYSAISAQALALVHNTK